VNELEELDDEGCKKLVVRRRVVGKSEPNRSNDSRAGMTRVGREPRLELRQVLGRVRDRKLTEAVGRDVPRPLILGLAVLKQRRPERVGDGRERVWRAVDDDLGSRSARVSSFCGAEKQFLGSTTHLLESLKSQVTLLVVRLNKLKDRR
jgi:hypothetical protein